MVKKYIGGLALIGVGAFCCYAGSVTAETSTKDNQGNYYGFTLALGTGSNALTDPNGILESLRGETVALDSVSVLTRTNNTFSDAKLAVYSFEADGNVGNFVGLSEAVSFVPAANVSFRFEDVELSVGERYQFLFVNANATEGTLTDTEAGALTFLQLYQAHSRAWGVSVTADQYSGSLLPGGWGTYTSNGLNAWEGHRMPVVALTVSSAAIPELSAFGLLAGIGGFLFASAGRHRRKPVPA